MASNLSRQWTEFLPSSTQLLVILTLFQLGIAHAMLCVMTTLDMYHDKKI